MKEKVQNKRIDDKNNYKENDKKLLKQRTEEVLKMYEENKKRE